MQPGCKVSVAHASSCAVLAVGGSGNAAVLASAEFYNPAIGTWTSAAGLSEARAYFQMVLMPDGKGQ